jgi:AraC-like DNA-binding protein
MADTNEFAHFWIPRLSGVELFQARICRYAFDKHFHDAYTIGLNEKGLGQSLIRGRLVDSPANSFNLINPGEVHTGKAGDGQSWHFRNLYISLNLMQRLLEQLDQQQSTLPVFREPVAHDLALRSLFLQVFQALDQAVPLLTQQSLLLELMAHLLQHHSDVEAPPPAVQESRAVALVRAYLEEHYTENVSLESLSQLSQLSPYYLVRCFRQQIGLPPHHYQRQVRLLKAKQALHTSQPLAAIASDAGFFDQSHFTRSFKRVFGVPPGQYRQGNSVQYPSFID